MDKSWNFFQSKKRFNDLSFLAYLHASNFAKKASNDMEYVYVTVETHLTLFSEINKGHSG